MRLTSIPTHPFRRTIPVITGLVVLGLSAAPAWADPPATVAAGPHVRIETLERGVVEGVLTSIDANRVVHVEAAGTKSSVNLNEIRAIDVAQDNSTTASEPVSRITAGAASCHLTDGGRVSGRLRSRVPRSIRIDPVWSTTLTIPFEGLRAVRFGFPDNAAEKELAARMIAEPSARDLLIVAKDDKPVVLPGALEGLGPRNWVFRLPSRLQKAPLDKAYAVVLGAAPGAPGKRPEHFFLTGGDHFTGDIRGATAESMQIRSAAFGDLQLAWTQITRLEIRSPLVTWLADAKFKSQTVKSALGVDWSPRANLNVTGGPIKLGGRTFVRGLGVHGTTSVSYELDGKQSRLQATIGIDDAMAKRGSVVFRVLGDGRELFKSEILRGGAKPVDISVDISGVKLLELSTDAADGLDLGDHANWADLRMIRADGGGVS